MSVWAIVVAGGSGSRFGGLKQRALLAGRPVVDWATAPAADTCDGVVVVLPAGSPEIAEGAAVAGGGTRSESVRRGLVAVPPDADVIVVHDAARPLASPRLFRAVVAAVRAGADGAVPALPVADTVKRVEGDLVVETVDRSALVAVQTPQAFRAEALRRAHASQAEATDDAALVEQAGGKVVVVPGETRNGKITDATDLAAMEALMAVEP